MKVIIDLPYYAYMLLKNQIKLDNIAEKIIANGKPYEERPTGEWIPVSVQEPDVGGIYFVTAKNVSGYIGTDIARRLSDDVWTFGGEELSGTEIIAWMPLPEPYKETENEHT